MTAAPKRHPPLVGLPGGPAAPTLVRGLGPEAEALDLALQVCGLEVPVDLRRDARVLVPQDLLDGRQVGPLMSNRDAVECRRWWKRILRTWPTGKSRKSHFGQSIGFAWGAASWCPQPFRRHLWT